MDIANGKVRVYNFSTSPVGFPSQHSQAGVFLRGRDEEEEFVVERVAFDDIEAENSKSDLFKVGRLRFHLNEEDEVYGKLGIEDKENIMSDDQLVKLLLEDSITVVKKIADIKSTTLITRMKTMLFTMERAGKTPPHKVNAAVIEREGELLSGNKRNPNSEISKILELDNKINEENKLKEDFNLMKQEIEHLKNAREEELKANKVKDDLLAQSESAIKDLLKQVEKLSKPQAKDKKDESKDTPEK